MSANTVAIRSAVRNALADCSAGDLILVAVSGGADSLALAYALSLEAPKLALRIEGVTVDHQLQSQSSVRAEKVVAALSKMGIQKTHVIKVDVDITDGLEASARRARAPGPVRPLRWRPPATSRYRRKDPGTHRRTRSCARSHGWPT